MILPLSTGQCVQLSLFFTRHADHPGIALVLTATDLIADCPGCAGRFYVSLLLAPTPPGSEAA